MPLTDDDHRISVRVQPQDTDPDNEVGIVGHTLNRLAGQRRQRTGASCRIRLADAAVHHRRQPRAANPAGGDSGICRTHSSRQFRAAADHRVRAGPYRVGSTADDARSSTSCCCCPAWARARICSTEDVDLAELVSQRGERRGGGGADAPLGQRPARRTGVGARGSRPAAPTRQQSAHQCPGAHTARGDRDDRNHLPPRRSRRALRGTDGRRRRARHRRRISCPGCSSGSSARTRPGPTVQASGWAWPS